MSQRPKSSQSVALFPFLAVLVCTMGSLIFLLLVTTRMIRDNAVAQAASEKISEGAGTGASIQIPDPLAPDQEPSIPLPPEPEPPVSTESKADDYAVALGQRQREIEDLSLQWKRRVEVLAAQRADRLRQVQQRQQLQQAAAQRLTAMQNESRELEVKLGGMTGELSASAMDVKSLKERADLEKQIADLKKRLRAAQESQPADGAFEVVPFDVNTGTSRRPILIECTDSGLRFLPEQVTISPNDLAGFTPNVNPLLAGSTSLVNYWTAWNIRQPNPKKEPEPYVLLLVRPSGSVAYYVAMKMLSNLKQPNGYELIEEDTVLQLPPVDAGAQAACEAAVHRLVAERNQILRAAGQGGFGLGQGGNSDGFRVEAASNRPMSGNGSKGNRGSSDGRTDSSGGSGTISDPDKFELTDITGKDGTGKDSWDRVENFEGRQPRSVSSGLQPTGGKLGSPRAGATGSPGAPAGQVAAGSQGVVGQGPAGVPRGSVNVVTARNGDPNADSASGADGRGNAPPAGGPRGGQPKTDSGEAGDAGSPSGIETLDGSDEGDGDSKSSEGNDTRKYIGLGSTGRQSPIPVQDMRRKKGRSSEKPQEFAPQQLVNHHWGISEPGATIGLEREMRIDVEPDRFVIAQKHAVSVNETDSRDGVFDRMVTVLDVQARDWGKPPSGFFWKPRLRYVVAKGGDARYEEIHSLMEQAGLAGSREYAPDHPEYSASPKSDEKDKTSTVASPAKPEPVAPAPKPSRRHFWGLLK